jgi:hypothetical protein
VRFYRSSSASAGSDSRLVKKLGLIIRIEEKNHRLIGKFESKNKTANKYQSIFGRYFVIKKTE